MNHFQKTLFLSLTCFALTAWGGTGGSASAAPATQQFSDTIGLWIQEPTVQITPFDPRGLGSFTTQGGYSIPGTINVAYGAYYELPYNKMKPGQYAIFTNTTHLRPVLSWTVTADEANNRYAITSP